MAAVEIEAAYVDWLRLYKRYTLATAIGARRSAQKLHDDAGITRDDLQSFSRYYARIQEYIDERFRWYKKAITDTIGSTITDEDNEDKEQKVDANISVNELYTQCSAARNYISFRFHRTAPALDRLAGKFSHLRTHGNKSRFIYNAINPTRNLREFSIILQRVHAHFERVYSTLISPFLRKRPATGFSREKGYSEVLPLVHVMLRLEAPLTDAQFRTILQPPGAHISREVLANTVDQQFIERFLPDERAQRLVWDFEDASNQNPRFYLAIRFSHQNRQQSKRIKRIALHKLSALTSTMLYFYLHYCRGEQAHDFAFGKHGGKFKGGKLQAKDVTECLDVYQIENGDTLRDIYVALLSRRFQEDTTKFNFELHRVSKLFRIAAGVDTKTNIVMEQNRRGQLLITSLLSSQHQQWAHKNERACEQRQWYDHQVSKETQSFYAVFSEEMRLVLEHQVKMHMI